MTRDDFRALCDLELGKWYVWGAEGPDTYDCSGLVCWALKQLKVSRGTARSSRELHRFFVDEHHGEPVDKDKVDLGDLCFYTNGRGRIIHVTMGWGGGQVFEAGKGGSRCTSVAIAKKLGAEVMISDIDRHSHYKDAVRPKGLRFDDA